LFDPISTHQKINVAESLVFKYERLPQAFLILHSCIMKFGTFAPHFNVCTT